MQKVRKSGEKTDSCLKTGQFLTLFLSFSQNIRKVLKVKKVRNIKKVRNRPENREGGAMLNFILSFSHPRGESQESPVLQHSVKKVRNRPENWDLLTFPESRNTHF